MKAYYKRHLLQFKKPAGTSRGIMTEKESWFLILEDDRKRGIGECGLLRSLSIDDRPDYERKLQWVCDNIHLGEQKLWDQLLEFPSIQFGVECAFRSFNSESIFELFPSPFTEGIDSIAINGLIWMGSHEEMMKQVEEKISGGFRCLKMKVGAIDFGQEMEILSKIRSRFNSDQLEIRVDANGAFGSMEALNKLNEITGLDIHSIEQPIAPKQHDTMAGLCKAALIAIALDEELIGVFTASEKEALLRKIAPQYIILKPSLVGGFRGCDEWISIAEQQNIGWWITSALESNVGLNAIAQWTYMKNIAMPQGLGTGSLYSNNFPSPLKVEGGVLKYDPAISWEVNL